jgi:hypothetical protein
MQVSLEEDDAEEADEQDESTSCHLVDGCSNHEKSSVHERGTADVANSGQSKQGNSVSPQDGWAGVKELGAIIGSGCSFSIAIFLGINRLIASVLWCRTIEPSPESHEANDQPAAHLADEHLGGLENRLVKESALPWTVIGATVSDTLVVLWRGESVTALLTWMAEQRMRSACRHT